MPSREESGSRGSRRVPASPQRSGATARPRPSAKSASQDEDEVWDEIMEMKQGSGGGDGGFDKMNTNFYLSNGEEIDIVILDNVPTIFNGHVIKCQGNKKDGGTYTFYRTEACQKSAQDYCVLCETENKNVGKSKKIIAFRVLDSRGSWSKDANNGKGGLDGIPTPKIFLVSLDLAKQIKVLRDDAGGDLTDKVIKLSKNEKYIANFKFKKNPNGSLNFVDAPEFDGELPEILEVYAPLEDDDLIDFVRKFSHNEQPQAPARSGGSNRRAGSFGD